MSADLKHFETFLTVVETGNFTAAANKLGISKAAVSNTIKHLEQSFGCSLFIRTTRSVTLSDEGELLLEQCLRLKVELDATRRLVKGFVQTPSGTLRISSNPHLAQTRLLPIIKQYLEKYPHMHLDVILEERMPDMHKEAIDLVFGVNWPAPDNVVAREIGQTRYVLCASPNYLAKHGTPKSKQDLSNHHYIPHLGRKGSKFSIDLNIPAESRLNARLRINDSQFIKQCALDDLGIAQLHEYRVALELNQGKLVELLPPQEITPIPLYVYYQKHRFVQPKIKHFVSMMLTNL
jgi:DNA-binding transcriptional LysR family regulator